MHTSCGGWDQSHSVCIAEIFSVLRNIPCLGFPIPKSTCCIFPSPLPFTTYSWHQRRKREHNLTRWVSSGSLNFIAPVFDNEWSIYTSLIPMSMHRHVTEWEIGFWWEEYSGRIPWRDSVKLRVFAVFRRTVRGTTYCQHPPACGGAGFGGKGSDLRRKKNQESKVYKWHLPCHQTRVGVECNNC